MSLQTDAEQLLACYDLTAEEVDAILGEWNGHAFQTEVGALGKLQGIAYEHVLRREGEWGNYRDLQRRNLRGRLET